MPLPPPSSGWTPLLSSVGSGYGDEHEHSRALQNEGHMEKLSARETQPGGQRQGLYTTALDKLHTQRWSLRSNDHYGMTSSQRGCISAECQHTLGRPGGCSSCSVSEQHELLEIANTGMFIVGGFPGHQTAGITCQIQTLANRLS